MSAPTCHRALVCSLLVIQESPGEGARWSIMSLTGISYRDAGDYRCKAKNLAGTSEAVVSVTVVGTVTTTLLPDTSERNPGEHPNEDPQPGAGSSPPLPKSWLPPGLSSTSSYSTPSTALSTSPPPPSSFSLPLVFSVASAPTSVKTSSSESTVRTSHQPLPLHPGGKSHAKLEKNRSKFPPVSASKKEELALLDQAMPTETNVSVADLRVASETGVSATLTWNISTRGAAVTVLYSKYGEKDLLLVDADYGENQATIDGLEPGSQYVACVCPKGVAPRKDQCIIFTTNGVAERDSQWSFLIVVTSTACVIVVPLICFLLYKVCKLQCTSDPFWEDDLAQETYIQFETLSPRSQSIGELWTRRHRDDTEKLLLCSQASVDTQLNSKCDGCRPEYYC